MTCVEIKLHSNQLVKNEKRLASQLRKGESLECFQENDGMERGRRSQLSVTGYRLHTRMGPKGQEGERQAWREEKEDTNNKNLSTADSL